MPSPLNHFLTHSAPTASANTLVVAGLLARRGQRTLFRDLSFAAKAGQCVMVTGANGSGKSTLLRILAGLTTPDAGTVHRVGAVRYLGHALGWKESLSAFENVQWAWRLSGLAHDTDSVHHALHEVGLARQSQLAVARLSQGQKKRLHLARLSADQHALWLLDEPTAALDDEGTQLVTRLIDEHLQRGGVACVASHVSLPLPQSTHGQIGIHLDVVKS